MCAQTAKPWLKFSPSNPFAANPLVKAETFFRTSRPSSAVVAQLPMVSLEPKADSSDDEEEEAVPESHESRGETPPAGASRHHSHHVAAMLQDPHCVEHGHSHEHNEHFGEPLHIFPEPVPHVAEPSRVQQLVFGSSSSRDRLGSGSASMSASPSSSLDRRDGIGSRKNSAAASLARAGEALRRDSSTFALNSIGAAQSGDSEPVRHMSANAVMLQAAVTSPETSRAPTGSFREGSSRDPRAVAPWSGYLSYPWFFPKMSQASAERLLSEKGNDGEFLVRFAAMDPVSIVLSVHDGRSVQTVPIAHDNRTWNRFSLAADPLLVFSSLTRLVEFYQRNLIAGTRFRLKQSVGPAAITRSTIRADTEARSRLNTAQSQRPPTLAKTASLDAVIGATPAPAVALDKPRTNPFLGSESSA